MKRHFLLLHLYVWSLCVMAQSIPQLRVDNIGEMIGAMTLEEKAQLLVGGGNSGFVGSGPMLGRQKKLVEGAAGITLGIPRVGIPSTVLCDGPAGVHIDVERDGSNRKYYATGFPIGTSLASTWNLDLAEQVGRAIGSETLEYGCDVILGPGLNLHRNPLCGRNFEYYSEDPYVTGVMGVAVTKGIQSKGVGVSLKHFTVNSQETDRTRVDARLSQRALRELYLRGFERVVREANPWTIMASYNKVNGVYVMGNRELLTDLLRNEWGYKGIVLTDWIGKRGDLPTYQEIVAGTDLLMPGYPAQVQDIVEAVNSGKLSMADVDLSVRRMLEYIVKTPRFKGYEYSDNPDVKAHAAITRQSGTEGMVLLKNAPRNTKNGAEMTLPLKNVKTVALFGVNSYDFLSGGLGSGCVNVPYSVDMCMGLKNNGIETTKTLTGIYRHYINYARLKLKADKNPAMWFLDQGQPKFDEIEITQRCIENELPHADAAIITIGRQAGEGMDRSIENEFNLTAGEKEMIHRVSNVFRAANKPVIVIINSGSVMETASWRTQVDAILVAWQPGQEGGNAVADILTGKSTPSGKLPMTWPLAATDHPSTANFPQDMDMYTFKNELIQNYGNIKGMDYANHEEDIYVGYRYFDTFGKEVAYPFGYGLSYTSFAYGKPKVEVKGEQVSVTLTVKNTGTYAGKEVVQVYVSSPQGKMQMPTKELKAFAKTPLLQPGETTTVKMRMVKRDLASFDEEGSRWLLESGNYGIHVGAHCADIRHSQTVRLTSYTEQVGDILQPKVKLNLLKQ